VNPDFQYIRASLDGFNNLHGVILEIKCPGRADHETALNGRVPDKYYPQLQHQFLACPSAKVAHYYSFDGEKGVTVIVEPNREYMQTLFEAETRFWKCILNDTPPEFTEGDFKRVRSRELGDLLSAYDKGLEELRVLKENITKHEKIGGRRVIVNDKWKLMDDEILGLAVL
jgi:predicted phage-related endonuclease